ncbi:hypothetical protein D9758_012766 [Tetrapyrgos nigripes]|uniref:Transmembrane protein n=1 Tax=Tetrapyrgos nigripes TaxID=182062 RepID=A0A8H5CQZ9_9AGAR|nr:hypothetical protein D9758_012766 [Tetrapyrgos nigripes]
MPGFNSIQLGSPIASITAVYLTLVMYTVEVCLSFNFIRRSLRSISGSQRSGGKEMIMRLFFRIPNIFLGLGVMVDTVCVVAICAHIAYAFAGFPIQIKIWTIPTFAVATSLSGAIEHAYFIHRYWAISHNKITTGGLICCTTTHTLFPIIAVAVLIADEYEIRPTLLPDSIRISAALSAFTDIAVAIVTLWTLRSATVIYDSTRSLLRRFSILIIASGCLSSTFTLLLLITSIVNPDGYAFIYLSLGRIYTLTTVINCLLMPKVRASSSSSSDDDDSDSEIERTVSLSVFSPSGPGRGRRRGRSGHRAERERRSKSRSNRNRERDCGNGNGEAGGMKFTSHVMSYPRAQILSSHLDPITKPSGHVPAFSIDSLTGGMGTGLAMDRLYLSRDDSASDSATSVPMSLEGFNQLELERERERERERRPGSDSDSRYRLSLTTVQSLSTTRAATESNCGGGEGEGEGCVSRDRELRERYMSRMDDKDSLEHEHDLGCDVDVKGLDSDLTREVTGVELSASTKIE